MKAMLYMQDKKDPVAVLDEVNVVKMNDNHSQSPYRIAFSAARLNAGRTMIELHRDQKMRIRLDDGREATQQPGQQRQCRWRIKCVGNDLTNEQCSCTGVAPAASTGAVQSTDPAGGMGAGSVRTPAGPAR
jgi:hypothetical protein